MTDKAPKFKHPGGIVGLPRRMIESPAYRALSPNARCLTLELQRLWSPYKATVHMSVREASEALGFRSTYPGEKALAELESTSFIRLVREANFLGRRSREWSLTWQAMNGHEPTNSWMDTATNVQLQASVK